MKSVLPTTSPWFTSACFYCDFRLCRGALAETGWSWCVQVVELVVALTQASRGCEALEPAHLAPLQAILSSRRRPPFSTALRQHPTADFARLIATESANRQIVIMRFEERPN